MPPEKELDVAKVVAIALNPLAWPLFRMDWEEGINAPSKEVLNDAINDLDGTGNEIPKAGLQYLLKILYPVLEREGLGHAPCYDR